MKTLIPILVWLALIGGGEAPVDHASEGPRLGVVAESPASAVPAADTVAVLRELLSRNRNVMGAGGRPLPGDLDRCDPSQGHICFPAVRPFGFCHSGRPCDEVSGLRTWIAFLARTAAMRPDVGLPMGLAVYSMVREGEEDVAANLVANCQAQAWWCGLLEGYVVHATGDHLAAEDQFRTALAMSPDSVRCEFVQANLVLAGGQRRALDRADCIQREAVADTVWWLADPLYASGSNDRLTTHLARTLEARLLLVMSFGSDYDPRRLTHDHLSRPFREALWSWYLPRGHPDSWARGDAHTSPSLPPGLMDQWTSRAAARYHFVPDFEGEGFGQPTWRLEARLEDEGYTPSYGTFHEVAAQVARFRGGGGMRVAVTGTLVGSEMEGAGAAEPHLILSDGPGSFPAREVTEFEGLTARYLTEVSYTRHVLSHEVLGQGQFGRHRVMLEPLEGEGPGISDLLLFRADDGEPPLELEEALARMLADTRIDAGGGVGLYWETYGVESDTPVDLVVTLEGERPGGVLGALARLLPGGGPDTPVQMEWSESPHEGAHGHAVTIDLPELGSGRYTLVVRADWEGSDGPVETRRVVRVGS